MPHFVHSQTLSDLVTPRECNLTHLQVRAWEPYSSWNIAFNVHQSCSKLTQRLWCLRAGRASGPSLDLIIALRNVRVHYRNRFLCILFRIEMDFVSYLQGVGGLAEEPCADLVIQLGVTIVSWKYVAPTWPRGCFYKPPLSYVFSSKKRNVFELILG